MAATEIPLYTFLPDAIGLADRMTPSDVLRIAKRLQPGVVANPIASANISVNRRYEELLRAHQILEERYEALVANLRGIMQWLPPEGPEEGSEGL